MTHRNDPHIGFIGLGLMGEPMARNLKESGASITVFNRSPAKLEQFRSEGFDTAKSPADVAQDSDIVICMVSDTAAVESVLFGPAGVIQGISAKSVVVDMGTTAVQATREFARKLQAHGVGFVDAPVSGGQVGAIHGTLSIMVGASSINLQRVNPLLQILGNQIVHVGEVGCGQIAKAANQIIVGLTIGAVAEAFALAKFGGADLDQVWQALRGGFADSKILELHGRRMVEGNFQPGGTAKTQRKDLQQALEFADAVGVQLPSTLLCRTRYEELIAQGDGHLDHSALYRLYSD